MTVVPVRAVLADAEPYSKVSPGLIPRKLRPGTPSIAAGISRNAVPVDRRRLGKTGRDAQGDGVALAPTKAAGPAASRSPPWRAASAGELDGQLPDRQVELGACENLRSTVPRGPGRAPETGAGRAKGETLRRNWCRVKVEGRCVPPSRMPVYTTGDFTAE